MPLLVAGASGGCATGSSTLPTSPSPAARAGHILTYDALEGRVRLFGGFSGATSFGEVWEVVQGRWVRVSTDAPLLDRTWPTLAFDAYHRIHVLFGGKTMDRVPYGDTWLFDGKNWRPHAGPGPAARSHHTAVFDPSRRVIVLFGGDDNEHLFRDTWEWSEDGWTQVATDGPSERAAHFSAYDPHRKMVIVAGGVAPDNETRLRDSWGWDGKTWRQLDDLPHPLALGAATSIDQGVLLFGGWRSGFTPQEDTLQLTPTGWIRRPGVSPPARSGSAALYLPDRKAVLLSGGLDDSFTAMSDAWLWVEGAWVPKPALAFAHARPQP